MRKTSKVVVAQFEVLKGKFLLEIQNIVCTDSGSSELVINFD